MIIIRTIATLGTLLALYLLSEGFPLSGFSIGAFSNILWVYIGQEKDLLDIMLVNVVLFFFNLNGLELI